LAIKLLEVFQAIRYQSIYIGNGMENPGVEPFNNEVGLKVMVTGLWEDIVNLLNERNGSLPNASTEVIQIACAVNAIHKVWMTLVQPILKDILYV
jgi:hypothetical protein